MRAYSKAHAKANPESVKRRSSEYQQRKKRWKPSRELILKLFQEQAGFCPCCGETIGSDYHVDHLQPTLQGGGNEESNLMVVHRVCNQDKHAKNFAQYLAWRRKCGMKVVTLPTEACAAKIVAHLLACS
jgi:5-methylcytosine-specific restriction endonuclease McrA